MKTSNTIAMNESPVKALVSTFFGMVVGIHTLLSAPDQLMTLAVACAKTFVIGGFAWFGQTFAGWCKKQVVIKYKAFKTRKKND